MKPYTCTEEEFLKDVSKHEMTIIRDDGVNRHLRFKRPNESSYWFDIVTWNGILVINGDMGNYMFSRIEDMFEFFRTDSKYNKTDGLAINPSYWGEKLLAVNKDGSGKGNIQKFDEDAFKDQVKEHFEMHFQDDIEELQALVEDAEAFSKLEKDAIAWKQRLRKEIWEDIEYELSMCTGEHELTQTVYDYEWWEENPHYKKFYFKDFFDGQSYYNYTFHYIWCCYAISWAIKAYDSSVLKLKDAA